MTSLGLGRQATPNNTRDAEKCYAAENSVKEERLFKRIRDYYEARPELLDSVRDICVGQAEQGGRLSLRRLDAIVTKNTLGNLCYFIEAPIVNDKTGKKLDRFEEYLVSRGVDRHTIPFNMVASYEQQLRHYQKRYFDSFRRRSKVCLDGFDTSYCQLNFFVWIDQYRLLRHIESLEYLGEDDVKFVSRKKNKAVKDRLVLYVGPVYVPAVPPPPVKRFKLVLKPEKEYALLQRAIYYHRIESLKDLRRHGGPWTRLLEVRKAS